MLYTCPIYFELVFLSIENQFSFPRRLFSKQSLRVYVLKYGLNELEVYEFYLTVRENR